MECVECDIYSEMKKCYGMEPEHLEALIKDYENGVSAYKISKKYNISDSIKVYTIVKKFKKQKGHVVRDYTEKRKIFEKSEELAKIKSRYNLDESDLADMLQMHEDKISAFNISQKYNLNGSSEVYTILKKANKVLGNIEEKRDFISEKEIENRMNFYTMNITFGYEIKDIAECANLDEKTVKSKITFAKKLKRTIEELRENDYSDEDIINKFNEKGIELTSSIMKKIKSKEDRGQADR